MDINEYISAVNNLTLSDEFANLDESGKQLAFRRIRDGYLEQNPDADKDIVNRVTEEQNKNWLRNTGRGRAIPDTFIKENNIIFPHQEPGYAGLSREEKIAKLEAFKETIPSIAEQNPIQRDDTEFFLNQSVRQLEREAKGEGVGYISDKGKRITEGFLSTLAQFVGAPETAENIQDYFEENPKYDEDFAAKLSQGLGSAGSSIVIMAGLAATTKGLGGTAGLANIVGSSGMLGGNAILRYNEAYKKAIDLGLDDSKATDAGVAALPASVIDTMADRIIVSRLMPKRINNIFATGSDSAKRATFAQLFKDNSYKGKLMEYAIAGIASGAEEAAGDFTAGYLPFLKTKESGFLMKDEDLLDSFLVGAALGAGINSAIDLPDFIGNKRGAVEKIEDENGERSITPKYDTKTQRNIAETEKNLNSIEDSAPIYKLLSEGKYRDAYTLSRKMLERDDQQEEQDNADSVLDEEFVDVESEVMDDEVADEKNNINEDDIITEVIKSRETNIEENAGDFDVILQSVDDTKIENFEASTLGTSDPKEIIAISKSGTTLGFAPIKQQEQSAEQLDYSAPTIVVRNKNTGREAIIVNSKASAFEVPLLSKAQNPERPIITTAQLPQWMEESNNPYAAKETPVSVQPAAPKAQKKKTEVIPPELMTPEQLQKKPIANIKKLVDKAISEGKPVNASLVRSLGWRSISGYTKTGDVMHRKGAKPNETKKPVSKSTDSAMTQAEKDLEDIRRALGDRPIENQEVTIEDELKKAFEAQNGGRSATDFLEGYKKKFKGQKLVAINQMIVDIKTKNPNLKVILVKIDGVQGAYDGGNNIIYLSSLKLTTVAHEVSHALTQADLNTFVNNRPEATYKEKLDAAAFDPATPMHIKSLINVYYHSAKALGFYDEIGKVITTENFNKKEASERVASGGYFFSNLDEFTSEAYASQSFQEKLSEIMYNGKTVWQHIVEAVSNAMQWIKSIASDEALVLRHNGENALVATLTAINSIVTSNNEFNPNQFGETINTTGQNKNETKANPKRVKKGSIKSIYRQSAEGVSYPEAKRGNSSLINVDQKTIVDELNKLESTEEKLNWLHNNGFISLIDGNTAVDYYDRVMVLARVGEMNVPFYISTGQAGKKNVAAGKWYAVFGIGSSGWINKGTEEQINNQYGYPILQKIAGILNDGLGAIQSQNYLENEDAINSKINIDGFVPSPNPSDNKFWTNLSIFFDALNANTQLGIDDAIKAEGLNQNETNNQQQPTQEEVSKVVAEQEFSESVSDFAAQIISFTQEAPATPTIQLPAQERVETFESVARELNNELSAEDDVTILANNIISVINNTFTGSEKVRSLIEKVINLSENAMLKSYMSIERTVESADKQIVAEFLGFKSWGASVRKQFSEMISDFVIGVRLASEQINNIISKAASYIKPLLAGSAIVSMGTEVSNNAPAIRLDAAVESFSNSAVADAIGSPVQDSTSLSMQQEQYEDPGFSYDIEAQVEKLAQALTESPTVDFKDSKPSANTRIVAEWVVFNKDNNGKSFSVADKQAGKVLFFDANGVLAKETPALFGMTKGDFTSDEILAKDTMKVSNKEKITPAGRFETYTRDSKTNGKVGIYRVGNLTDLAFHKVYLQKPEENRPARLASETGADNRISHGCINLPTDVAAEVIPTMDDHVVYILPETPEGKTTSPAFNNINFLPVSDDELVAKAVKKGFRPQFYYHGTYSGGHTEFDTTRSGYHYGPGSSFTTIKSRTEGYQGVKNDYRGRTEGPEGSELYRVFLKYNNPYKVTSDAEINDLGWKINKNNPEEYERLQRQAASLILKDESRWQEMGPQEAGNMWVRNNGFDAIEKRWTSEPDEVQEVVIFNPANIKRASDTGVPIDQRFDETKNNINLLPEQTKAKKRIAQFKRMQMIQAGKLSDKTDSKTNKIIQILSGIKPSDIHLVSEELQDYFFDLVDNIYESRKNAVPNPQVRYNAEDVIKHLNIIKKGIDSQVIAKMMETYDESVDFDNADIDITNREAVEEYINQYMKEEKVGDVVKNQVKSQRAKARLQKIYEKFRIQFDHARGLAIERFNDADNYISEIESIYGQSIGDDSLTEFVKLHFDYLTSVDVSKLEGQELYNHFFAINNINDGTFMGFGVTAEYIANVRNSEQKINEFAKQFRDPVASAGRLLRTLDEYNRYAELHQVEMQRLSSYAKVNNFIQDGLLGRIYDGVIRNAENRKLAYQEEYAAFRDSLFGKGKGGESPLTTEDKVINAIAGRLVQFEVGTDPDAGLLLNAKKELKSIMNVINRSPHKETVRLYKTRVLPLFNQMIEGIDTYGEGVMSHFMDTIAERMSGLEGIEQGEKRAKLLEKTQEIFGRFTLSSRIISEGFHNKTFKQQAMYISNDVSSFETTAENNAWKMTDPIDTIDAVQHKEGVKAVASHYKERGGEIGDMNYYSYNSENILNRNIERLAVDVATISERFILAKRIKKGSALNNIISTDANGITHPQRISFIEEMVSKLIRNAVSRNAPLDAFTETLRVATSLFARPTLSSVHHIATQPLSAAIDYAVRTGNVKGWFDAALFYVQNAKMVDDWFAKNQRWTSERSAIEAMALDYRRSPADDEVKSIMNNPLIKWLEEKYEGASKIMTFFMRNGDNFSTKATILAEYSRLMKNKFPHDNLSDLDFNTPEGYILTQATLNAEQIVNTSNKILRGALFTDKNTVTTVLRNLLFAFTSHSGSLATQVNKAMRDIAELKSLGAPSSEIYGKIRTISAIALQQAAFTSARFTIGMMMAKGMIALIQALTDDEEGKIEELETQLAIARKKSNGSVESKQRIAIAENELQNAKNVRKIITKFKLTTSSGDSLFKQVIRDGSGVFHISFNNGAMQQVLFNMILFDPLLNMIATESQKEAEEELKERIRKAKEKNNIKEAAKLSEQLTVLSAAEYIPFAYPSLGGTGLGGLYGATLDSYFRVAKEVNGAVMGAKEWSMNDFFISAVAAGVGQSEMTKAMNLLDKIEDENWKANQSLQDELKGIKQEKKKPKIAIPGISIPAIPDL